MVRDFLHDEALGGEDKVLARYLKPELLIIDDMGMKQLPKRSGEYLFEIIMRRYETRSTMMTSNRPLEDWGKLIGDVPSATAILDRFLHHAEVIRITGQSYRLRNQARPADEGADESNASQCAPRLETDSGRFKTSQSAPRLRRRKTMTPLPASGLTNSPHPSRDQAHSLPTPGPPASFFSVRPTHDGIELGRTDAIVNACSAAGFEAPFGGTFTTAR